MVKTRARGDEAEGRSAGESRAVGAQQLKGLSRSDRDGGRDNAPGWQRSHRWWQGVEGEQGTPRLDRSWWLWVTRRGLRLLGGKIPEMRQPREGERRRRRRHTGPGWHRAGDSQAFRQLEAGDVVRESSGREEGGEARRCPAAWCEPPGQVGGLFPAAEPQPLSVLLAPSSLGFSSI